MRRDRRVITMATVRNPALKQEFGAKRVRVTPIAEAAFTGWAAAGSGFRPVVPWGMVTSCCIRGGGAIRRLVPVRPGGAGTSKKGRLCLLRSTARVSWLIRRRSRY